MAFRLNQLRRLIREAFGNAYRLLGVSPNATQDEIKAAYREFAKKLHPDKNPGNQAVADQFKKISAAYNAVSNPEARKTYNFKGDRFVDDEGPVQTPAGAPPRPQNPPPPRNSPYDRYSDAERKRREDAERARQASERDRQTRKKAYRDEQQKRYSDWDKKKGPADDYSRSRESEAGAGQQHTYTDTSTRTRKFVFNDTGRGGTSNKFWTIGDIVTENPTKAWFVVKWGRVGSAGQTTKHEFTSILKARKAYWDLIDSKRTKGYVEQPQGSGTTGKTPPNAPPPHQGPPPPPKGQKPEQKPPTGKGQPGKKDYKIYGKKGKAPVHTRFGGKVYAPTGPTRFRNGDKASVGLGSDGRLGVHSQDGRNQTWDASNESVQVLVDEMVTQFIVEQMIVTLNEKK